MSLLHEPAKHGSHRGVGRRIGQTDVHFFRGGLVQRMDYIHYLALAACEVLFSRHGFSMLKKQHYAKKIAYRQAKSTVDSLTMAGAVSIQVKVVPRASHSELGGWKDGVLKVRVAAPPEQGKANAALEALLAERLGVRKSAVRVVAGHGSPRKRVEIDGLVLGEVERRLGRGSAPVDGG